MKKALITGVTGQDGAFLSELLLGKGYEVHGIKRRSSLINTHRVDHLYIDPKFDDTNFYLHHGDLTDATNLIRIVQEVKPDEIYNLAAQSHVQVSFETPEYTANSDAVGTLRLLEAIRILGLEQKTKSFCDLVGVDKIEDIFTTQPITFITRDPWSRFWSGLFEVIGENINEKINQIDKAILNDTHLSLWNTFLIELILHYEIKEHEIIDLNNPLITERYGVKTIAAQESTNRLKYKPWLENEDNKVYIEKLQTILKPYMDLEINSYNKLLNYE